MTSNNHSFCFISVVLSKEPIESCLPAGCKINSCEIMTQELAYARDIGSYIANVIEEHAAQLASNVRMTIDFAQKFLKPDSN